MKKVIIKYWFVLPFLLALLIFSLVVLFTETPSVLETIVGSLLLLTFINVATKNEKKLLEKVYRVEGWMR